ncbi:Transducin/WD40 repeat-like superfamily protein isoform 1 [Tripterygium wilfordii]|uniref:Transducin/WD40 repeat-like superfamily protein isoform 1 n=1 Tax=Tripterygium wilfordii TaxID=458696 RepID=A0A7J7D6H3_TRIWF|nr:protein JINGUBANG-like [Tripterygium wilfordii]KAF5741666.1 Transducin/WD40 repeat-like superfamily protein isoform 1 [Tripterygium wilfordii]
MASILDSQNSPSFRLEDTTHENKKLMRNISVKEFSFSEINPYSPPRLSCPTLNTYSYPYSSSPSPTHCHNAAGEASHKCVSSILKKDSRILSMALSNGLIYTGSDMNMVRIWKFPDFTEFGQLKTRACMVMALAVSNDKVFGAYGDGNIRVWHRAGNNSHFRYVRLGTIPRNGRYVRSYITGKDKMKHSRPITSLAINTSDDVLYSASLDKTVKVWRISDFKCIETIQAHPQQINSIVVADDGILYTASDDATVRVWRRIFCRSHWPHALIVSLPTNNSPVITLALSQDGRVLYGGCSDGYIHYWLNSWFSGQLQSGDALAGHTHAVLCMASVGRFVVSGSADSSCRVWAREQDGQHTCMAVLMGHRGPIRCISAHVDPVEEEYENGCTVCSGSLDGVIKVWHVTTTKREVSNWAC